MQQIATLLNQSLFLQKDLGYKNRRDELIKKAVIHINELRKGTPFESKIETPEKLARRINMNPFLAGKDKDGELEYLLKVCREKNNYAGLYAILKR